MPEISQYTIISYPESHLYKEAAGNYDDPIPCLNGIGETTAALYEKLGIVTIGELMRYYPRSYERFESPVTIRAAAVMDFAAVRVVICSYPK